MLYIAAEGRDWQVSHPVMMITCFTYLLQHLTRCLFAFEKLKTFFHYLMASATSLHDEISSKESSTSSRTSATQQLADKIDTIVDKVAKDRNLERSVVLDRMPPIDICVFGRSGIGKSELIKAITNLDVQSSGQLDHVTQTLTHVPTTIGPFTFRFWDTKGIDNWLDIDMIDHMFNEMKEQKVKPIFVIYCAAAGGRVDSDVIAGILKRFHAEGLLICYVITNMYAASLDQLEQQIDGGLVIMNSVFGQRITSERDKYCYLYSDETDKRETPSARKPSLLIAVNSCPFRHILSTFPQRNITELMEFLTGHLEDEELAKFVALTINNRSFWSRVSDATRTRVERIKNKLVSFKSQLILFFKNMFD